MIDIQYKNLYLKEQSPLTLFLTVVSHVDYVYTVKKNKFVTIHHELLESDIRAETLFIK